MGKHVVILHQELSPDSDASERDVLDQRDAIREALLQLGTERVTCQTCQLDLSQLQRELTGSQPDLVFNLVESLGGTDRLLPVVPMLLEAWEIPFTGCSSYAIQSTTDKLICKAWLARAGLPTPPWQEGQTKPLTNFDFTQRVIVKTVSEHASFDLDETSVCQVHSTAELNRILTDRREKTGRRYFAEQFIPGREFNLSILDSPQGPQILPAAEIDFSRFPTDQPNIVGYRAKWEEETDEYQLTPRTFQTRAGDEELHESLTELAKKCWELFSLRGYARVDFRVDQQGRPWILEINANPCLSPDAGFAAALKQAGISYSQAISQIVQAATEPR